MEQYEKEVHSFLGMPIEGDVYSHNNHHVEQLTKEDVGVLIHEVLQIPGVRGLAWTQYTPYWNDGETCVFRAREPYISLVGLEPEDYYDYSWMEEDFEDHGRVWINHYSDQFDSLVGDDSRNWHGNWPNRTWEWKIQPHDQPNPDLFMAFFNLSEAMDSGSCDHALLELFGDHAQILIDNEAGKVLIESYDHD